MRVRRALRLRTQALQCIKRELHRGLLLQRLPLHPLVQAQSLCVTESEDDHGCCNPWQTGGNPAHTRPAPHILPSPQLTPTQLNERHGRWYYASRSGSRPRGNRSACSGGSQALPALGRVHRRCATCGRHGSCATRPAGQWSSLEEGSDEAVRTRTMQCRLCLMSRAAFLPQ